MQYIAVLNRCTVALEHAFGIAAQRVHFAHLVLHSEAHHCHGLVFNNGEGATVAKGLQLPSGRNKFEQTVTVEEGTTLTPYIQKHTNLTAPLYIWNISVEADDADANVTYADSKTATVNYATVESLKTTFGLNTDADNFVTKIDLTGLKVDDIPENIYAGINMGTNAHLPANDKVTVSCDYFLSGDANKVQTTVGAAGTYAASGNPTLGAQATDPVGKGQL